MRKRASPDSSSGAVGVLGAFDIDSMAIRASISIKYYKWDNEEKKQNIKPKFKEKTAHYVLLHLSSSS